MHPVLTRRVLARGSVRLERGHGEGGTIARRSGGAPLGRGVTASVVASVLFGVIFLLARALRALPADVFFGWRVLSTLPIVALLFLATGRWRDVAALLVRLRRRPALVLVLILDGLMLGLQLWLFGWAPQTGHGLDAALGYLLLPLVMVLVGLALHRERMTLLRIGAVAAVAVGVLAALVSAGGLSPVTLAVALGYPIYFTGRRRFSLDTPAAFLLELVVLVPFAMWFLATERGAGRLATAPVLIGGVVLLGLLSGVALALYLAASKALGFGLFGLLTYLEPVLLVVVAVAVLGERLTSMDALVYGPIALALVLLAVEPFSTRPVRGSAGPAKA